MSTQKLAVISLVIVSLSYSLLSIGSRLLNEGFGNLTQVYVRLTLGVLLAGIIFHRKIRWDIWKSISKKDWMVLALMGIVGYALSVYFVTLGALNTKLLNVSVLVATTPFFVFLYSFILWRKKLRGNLLLLLLLSMVGVSFIASKSFLPRFDSFGKGEWYVLISAAFLGAYSVGRKLLSPLLNNYEITVIVMGIAALTAFVLALIHGETFNIVSFTNPHVILGLVLGVGLNVVTTQLENFSFQHLEAVVGTQILLLENAFAPILGIMFYREIPILPEVVGTLLVVLSVYFVSNYSTQE